MFGLEKDPEVTEAPATPEVVEATEPVEVVGYQRPGDTNIYVEVAPGEVKVAEVSPTNVKELNNDEFDSKFTIIE